MFIHDDFTLEQARKVENETNICKPPAAAVLISGCKDTEYSYDANFNGKPNGAFTYIALQELAKLPLDADYFTWFKAVRKSLPHPRYPQTPQIQGNKLQKKWKIFES